MKKNRMMRLASILLVCVLLTTSVISGTFAKYTTTVTNSDTARVAAWGFGTTTTLDFDLFSSSYNDSVVSSNSDKVIAPGTTQSETIKLNYAGTSGKAAPEVDYTIKLAVDDANTNIDQSILDNTAITWTFGSTTGTWEQVKTAINAYTQDVEANALPDLANTGVTISWTWEFEKAGNDATDTAMGDADPLASCTIAIKLTAEQRD